MGEGKFDHTRVAMRRLGLSGNEQGKVLFEGREVIQRDSPINGRVSIGAGEREAIVVDDTKEHGEPLKKIYEQLLEKLKKISEKDPALRERLVLREIFELTKKKMPVDTKIAEFVASVRPDKKVPLADFLHGGVCRHQALLAGYLIEKLIGGELLKGRISIDRSTQKFRGKMSAHVWARYTSGIDGSVYVLDAAQDYLAPLDIDYNDGKERWGYHRETDGEREKIMVYSENPFAQPGLAGKLRQLVSGKKVEPREVTREKRRSPIEPYPAMTMPALAKAEAAPEPSPFIKLEPIWREYDPPGTDPSNPITKGKGWPEPTS